ncbi:phytanoyl-CoA dioxygenase family protein [Acidomonas methanolica]|uniref:phytanoyl-CoA dioxygenase family protein n=1 Tax=Acidomonas methanolica TaxID=437 RepID=UPI00211A66F5|nr:phytanoyl-CoA dioxygenase family protein [Acidomonas methanolica]MCQ9154947.1 phytanoyl-CoA dioxygenase family protein [Acidomonas methanolica]
MDDQDANALRHYHEHGYVVFPELLESSLVDELHAVMARIEGAAVGLSEDDAVFDFEPDHRPDAPRIQRIKKPNRVDPFFRRLSAHPRIMGLVSQLIGPNIRLNHAKINMKSARVGSSLEWHQDWAFAPHTNMDTCVVSVMIDACVPTNGPLLVVPGSHNGPLLEHHKDGQFAGAVVEEGDLKPDYSRSTPLLGPVGTISIHHPMIVHGSDSNRSGAPRRILFLEYAAADAWPLFYHVDWSEYDSRLVAGHGDSAVRMERVPVKLPFPNHTTGSIYKTQAALSSRFFEGNM